MSHVERITTMGGFWPLDLERCGCGQERCDEIIIDRHAYSRKDVEHALKCLFGEARPGSHWYQKDPFVSGVGVEGDPQ